MGLGHRWRMATAVVATVAAAIFQLFIPRYVGQAVDNAQGLLGLGVEAAGVAQDALWTAGVMIVFFSVLRGLFTMLQNYHGEGIGHCIGYELRLAFYEQVQRLSFSFHDKVHTGDLITRGMLDLEGVRMFISTGLIRTLLLTILIGGSAYFLMSTNLVLGLLALSFVPFVGWRSAVARLKLRWMWLLMQERLSVITRRMEENLTGIRVVRAFSAQKFELDQFETASSETLDVAIQRVTVRVSNTTVMTFAFFASMVLVLWVGGLQVIDGEITVGLLAEVLTFMMILQMPVRQIGMMVNSFARASTCGARLFEVIDRDPRIKDQQAAPDLKIDRGVLKFENVEFSFGSGSSDTRVLAGVSFSVGSGETLGIVGPPGSGKSTIAHLVPRFYDVTGGRVSIDGQDIRDISLDSLRQAVSVVQQDAFLFTASIENNIAYGDPWSDGERIARANRSAQLHDYVAKLPGGYETLVGERGVSLSGGQRQRLSIARGILSNPSILVFDDSTAAVDAGTERRIRLGLREGQDKRATVIISHRLGSLMHADEILFIEAGRVVERGSHNELMALGRRYHDLYQLQSRPGEDHGVEVAALGETK
ncbi:MAG: ABC transporter ATP-binding protein [Alphaproteobacteria bacterium]|nr:ABC transporter ATP-binding protein [Alphaproteobacteria bacterium]